MTTSQTGRTWLGTRMAVPAMIALLSGCGDAAASDCEGCAKPDLQPACEEAAAQCDAVPANMTQTCIDEARALCE